MFDFSTKCAPCYIFSFSILFQISLLCFCYLCRTKLNFAGFYLIFSDGWRLITYYQLLSYCTLNFWKSSGLTTSMSLASDNVWHLTSKKVYSHKNIYFFLILTPLILGTQGICHTPPHPFATPLVLPLYFLELGLTKSSSQFQLTESEKNSKTRIKYGWQECLFPTDTLRFTHNFLEYWPLN